MLKVKVKVVDDLILLLNEVTSEKNSIENFASFGIKSDSAFDSQSLLQLK
jgi:hypothetical protein